MFMVVGDNLMLGITFVISTTEFLVNCAQNENYLALTTNGINTLLVAIGWPVGFIMPYLWMQELIYEGNIYQLD